MTSSAELAATGADGLGPLLILGVCLLVAGGLTWLGTPHHTKGKHK